MDMELLERARRLCLAAQQTHLPALRDAGDVRVEGSATASDGASRQSKRRAAEKLPLLPSVPGAAAALFKQEKKVVVQMKGDKKKDRRLVEERRRHEREMQRVKQAQQRARARIVRTNQLEQQEALRASEQQREEAESAAERVADKMKRAEESRRRAMERLRRRHHVQTSNTPPGSAPARATDSEALAVFHTRTIKRLHTSNRLKPDDHQDTPGRSGDVDVARKLLERKHRQETAARLCRMRQLHEDKKRQQEEEFAQGLQKYKSKLKEMDCVAKGLDKISRQPAPEQLTAVSNNCEPEEDTEMNAIRPPSAEIQHPSAVRNHSIRHQRQDADLPNPGRSKRR